MKYHMHLAAVVAVNADKTLLVSDMMEPESAVELKTLQVQTTTPATFLKDTFGDFAPYFVLGLLEAAP